MTTIPRFAGRRGRRPLQFKIYLQKHRCNGVLDRFKPPHRRGRPPGRPANYAQTGRRGRRPLQFKIYLQKHGCNGVLDRFEPPHGRGRPPGRPANSAQTGRRGRRPLRCEIKSVAFCPCKSL